VRPHNQGNDFPTLLALIIAVGFPLLLLSMVFDFFPRDRLEKALADLKIPGLFGEARPSPSPIALASPQPTAVRVTVPDWALPDGRFYTQTNGRAPLTSAAGYAVTDSGALKFWEEFQGLGGVDGAGFPLSNRFSFRGFTVQVFQKLAFQGNEKTGEVNLLNLMDDLSELKKDKFLYEERFVPYPLAPDFDAGQAPGDVPAARLALLADDPVLEKYYRESKDPLRRFGLPTSKVTDLGDYVVSVRCQRTVLQRWKKDLPWARANEVTVANAGQLAVEAGLFPPEGLQPTQGVPPLPTPGPSPSPLATPGRP
jgi:hypothetical protein